MSESVAARLPWEGRARRADKVIAAAIGASVVYSLVLLPAAPWLLVHHPVLLAALRGGMTAIVTLGAMARIGDVPLAVAVLVGLPATVMFDWAYWWAGRRWGERGLAMMLGEAPRAHARLGRAKQLSARFGPAAVLGAYFLPVPTFLIYAAAGWAGMGFGVFVVLEVLGALAWLALLAGLGYAIGQPAVDLVGVVADYTLWVTVVLVVLVIFRQFILGRRRARDAG